jgi:hypothetical protein
MYTLFNHRESLLFNQKMAVLPQELLDKLAFYLPLEKSLIMLSFYAKQRLDQHPTPESWTRFAEVGNRYGLEWLHYHRIRGCTKLAMNYAACNGHLEIVKWLHYNRYEGCNHWAMNFACGNGHLDTVKWLHVNRREGCTKDAMDLAARNGHLDIVKWLYANRKEGCTPTAISWATLYGHLDVLEWLKDNRLVN